MKILIDDATKVETTLVEAFDGVRSSGAREAHVEVSADIRFDRKLLDLLEKQIRTIPTLRRLTFQADSSSARFLVSTLALRVPSVEICVEVRGGEPASRTSRVAAPTPAKAPQSAVRSGGGAPKTGRYVIDAQDDLDTELTRAFARFANRRVTDAVIVFPASLRAPRQLSASLERLLNDATLESLTLVHPSGVFGFVASTLGLRFPKLRIKAQAAE